MQVTIAKRKLELPGPYLDWMEEDNGISGDYHAMRERIRDKGYLLLRGLLDRELALQSRRQMLEILSDAGALKPDEPLMDAVAQEGSKGGFKGGVNALTQVPAFSELISGKPIMEFFSELLGGPALTFDYRWLRIVAPGSATAAHYDIVYMGRGTLNLYTLWTPLGDISLEQGPLAVLDGSHRFDRVKETYGKMDVDRHQFAGSFSNDPIEIVDKHGGIWKTSEFSAGDVLIFGMFTMHASLRNESNTFRLSSDTRYQLASEPVDERWIGKKPIAHYRWHKGERVIPTEELREKWKV